MAYIEINSFHFDTETGNIIVQFSRPVNVSYEHEDIAQAYENLEGELYLDASTSVIGNWWPASLDGTIQQGQSGRQVGQTRNVVPDVPLQPVPTSEDVPQPEE
ncbi:hypothetical protein SEA_YABOI_139 [Streptomyces phage Yaboi]|uniref:Uncharacterized protein n=3 Tax=Streptomyces virus Yaboi TaxID=2846408 RepID=A0A385UIG8_9CAUD|nr:hypothetical protein HWB86_gp154 [Streptomyces phage Yaboi]QAY08790.1 hypothetical protein SEA_GENIE2_140 [Streptomyces phage Genie2]QAY12780.1 hypothetical protein SEA_BOOMERJR_140 [Streptomyces phage BoomerJR]UVD39974.1 hypothetical protein SEA_STANIMAL_138 [Streptomyces phage Stanimal]WNM73716.1 hypothetical protein SEA_SOLLERTIA_139 [Streptomyces phage Sollertia]AYB70965.1 hypothetical protein SEA_YABOI_139 [Streptomyces phage Yaboi]